MATTAMEDGPKNGRWVSGAKNVDDWMLGHKTIVAASTASLVATWTGFPLDSLKSRLQSSREKISLPKLAADVIREEGVSGLWRGSLLPLITIATVRTISFTIYTNTKHFVHPLLSPSSFPTNENTADSDSTLLPPGSPSSLSSEPNPYALSILSNPTILSVAGTSLIAGAASGAIVCLGSCPFELVKVRRQLEYQIARERREREFRLARGSPAAVGMMEGMIHSPVTLNISGGDNGGTGSISRGGSGVTGGLGAGGSMMKGHEHHSHGYDMVGHGIGEAQSGEEVKRAEQIQKARASAAQSSSTIATTSTSASSSPSISTSSPQTSSIKTSTTQAAQGDIMAGWKPPSTMEAVKDIYRQRGVWGLWTGFRLHAVRDTLGTSLYFAEYDCFRYILGRNPLTDKQGEPPEWARSWLPRGVIPFVCGSVAGVTSWALIYPVDAIKTKTQQRVLTGLHARPARVQLLRLLRGKDPSNPVGLWTGVGRLYRGLGISMLRSVINHGLLWTMVDAVSNWIDQRPIERYLPAG